MIELTSLEKMSFVSLSLRARPLVIFAALFMALATHGCKPRTSQVQNSSLRDSDAGTADCGRILTEAEEVAAIRLASTVAAESFSGKLSAAQRNAQLDELIARYQGDRRNAVRFNIARGHELAAAAWVLPRAIAYRQNRQMQPKDLAALDAMGVTAAEADAYLTDVGAYFGPHYDTLTTLGLRLTSNGWEANVDSLAVVTINKQPKVIAAMMLFFGSDVTAAILNPERDEALFVDQIAMHPPREGSALLSAKIDWTKGVRARLANISRESESFVRSSKAATTYSNMMKGRILEWFGVERGHQGKTAPEIEMEGAYRAMLAHIRALREDFGVQSDMRAKLLTMMQTLNQIELQHLNEGLKKLDKAQAAAIAAPFVPIIMWAAPYVGAAALGEAWAPAIAAASAKAALLPMAFAVGTSGIAAAIRTASLGGSFACNFYAQFTDRGADALATAPFMAAIPVVTAGTAGTLSAGYGLVSSGSLCAQTTYGLLNVGMSTGAVGIMLKSGVTGIAACHAELQKAQAAGEAGDMQTVQIRAEKAYQSCVQGGIDLGFGLVTAGKLTAKTYEAIRSRSWQPLVGNPCGKGGAALTGLALAGEGGCGGTPLNDEEKVATPEQLKPLVPDSQRLHTNIDNNARYEVIKNVPLDRTTSAPGHNDLRKPEAVVSMGKQLAATSDHGREMFRNADKIVLNVFTDGNANVKSIEVIDGNHRFAAGIYAEKLAPGHGWNTISDIPPEFLDIRVNGFNTNGQQLPRWVPLHVVENSNLPRDRWRFIPPEWGAKGPTAEIPGDFSSQSDSLKPEYRGVSMLQVVRVSLERIGMKLP